MRLQQLLLALYSFTSLRLVSSLDILLKGSKRDIFLEDTGNNSPLDSPRSPLLEPIDSDKLQGVLNVSPETLHTHAEELQRFATLDPDGNRAFGGPGHNLTVEYIYDWFLQEGMKGYYEIERLTFEYEYSYGVSDVLILGQTRDSLYFTYSPPTNGTLTAPLVLVDNLGCDPVSLVASLWYRYIY